VDGRRQEGRRAGRGMKGQREGGRELKEGRGGREEGREVWMD